VNQGQLAAELRGLARFLGVEQCNIPPFPFGVDRQAASNEAAELA
jgi:hypothetical protein